MGYLVGTDTIVTTLVRGSNFPMDTFTATGTLWSVANSTFSQDSATTTGSDATSFYNTTTGKSSARLLLLPPSRSANNGYQTTTLESTTTYLGTTTVFSINPNSYTVRKQGGTFFTSDVSGAYSSEFGGSQTVASTSTYLLGVALLGFGRDAHTAFSPVSPARNLSHTSAESLHSGIPIVYAYGEKPHF